MRDGNVYSLVRNMPRMSWHPRNLYVLWRKSNSPYHKTDFRKPSETLFQQRWKSKALIRAYHGDFINEKVFKRWYLPETLPDVRPRPVVGNDRSQLDAFALRERPKKREDRKRRKEDEKGLAPVGSLMLREVERRIDIFIFRCCFAHSVYEARRLVIHGNVLLNGKKHQNASTRLAPGDMVSVNPDAIRFLRGKPYTQTVDQPSSTEVEVDSPPADTQQTTSSLPSPSASSSSSSNLPADPTQQTTSSPPSPSAASSSSSKPPVSKYAAKLTARQSPSQVRTLTPFNLPPYASPHIFIPAYIEPSFNTCSAVFVRHPTARPGYSEIPTPYDADGEVIRLAWEWYAKVRSRVRSKRQMERAPEDRMRMRRFGLVR